MRQDSSEGGSSPFGRLLRQLRLDRALTMEELAEASGVSVRAISDMERGRSTRPRRGTVTALAQGLLLDKPAQDGLVAAARETRPADDGARPAKVTPCMLPRSVPDFVGREAELTALRELARRAATDDRPSGRPGRFAALPAAVVSGAPGSGKTTLAVHLAEECTASLTDGAFFLDMKGLDDRPLTVDEAVRRLLNAWGADGLPAARLGLEERLELYQTTAAELSAVLVLDNARDEAQVRPLLPAQGRLLVVITSRSTLAGLTSVRRVELGALTAGESTALLRAVVDDGRVEADPEAAGSVTELCGHLPLAVRVAANWAATRSNWSLQRLAARLADEDRRIDALSAGDLRVNSAFSLSYSRLSADTARMFRLLSLIPGTDFSTSLAAVLGGTGLLEAEDLLEELLEAGLLMTSPGDRYRFHDLLRLYARSRHREVDGEAGSATAWSDLRSWLLRAATAAGRAYAPGVHESPPLPFVTFDDGEAAMGWLKAERENWLGAYRGAAGLGEHRTVTDTARVMDTICSDWISLGRWTEVFELALRSATALAEPASQAFFLNLLSWHHWQWDRRHDAAVEAATSALAFATECGDLTQQAQAHMYLGWLQDAVDDVASAADNMLRAMDLFDRAGDLDRYLQAANVNITVLRKAGRTTEAEDTHHAVMRALADPGNDGRIPPNSLTAVISVYHVSYVYLNEGRWEQAAEALGSLRGQWEPRGYNLAAAKVYLYLGHSLAHLRRTEEAAQAYRAVLELDVAPPQELLDEARTGIDSVSAGVLPSRTQFE
ncbi:helix-turn-helix domain-containing protein [Streptomyces sp. NPDC059708]|uniref:helix-turn-helix domain-containing protein n=1 Tax=Streptomyces sp. NPDC059708 TaxID=3346916 RepID=UPI0036805DE6